MELSQDKNLADKLPKDSKRELYLLYFIEETSSEDCYLSEIGRKIAPKAGVKSKSGRGVVNTLISKLEGEGLIETYTEGERYLQLTDEGKEIVEIIKPLFVEDKKEKVRETLKEVMLKESRGNELLEPLKEDKFDTIKEKVWRKVDIELEKEELEKYVNAV